MCHQGKIEPEQTIQVIYITDGVWKPINGISSHTVHEWNEGQRLHVPGCILDSGDVVLGANTTTSG